MDDLSFWGAPRSDEPMSMAEKWGGSEDVAAELMSNEHAMRDRPSESVLLKRHLFPSYTEHLWVQGYPAVRMIVLTFPRVVMGNGQTLPGCVRELPVGWRDMSSAETFSSKLHTYVEQYEREGWKRA